MRDDEEGACKLNEIAPLNRAATIRTSVVDRPDQLTFVASCHLACLRRKLFIITGRQPQDSHSHTLNLSRSCSNNNIERDHPTGRVSHLIDQLGVTEAGRPRLSFSSSVSKLVRSNKSYSFGGPKDCPFTSWTNRIFGAAVCFQHLQ